MSFALITLIAAASPEAGSTVPTDVLIYVVLALAGGGASWAAHSRGVKQGKADAEKRIVEGKVDLPQPLEMQIRDQFVTRREFDQHCSSHDAALKAHISDNERNFEALYTQMRANDKLTAKISGCLEAIQGDLSLIKTKLFGGKK